jgi:predicted dehydrogenase
MQHEEVVYVTSRRAFLSRSVVLAGFAPRLVHAAGAHDRIVIGVIGTGGRGTWLAAEAQKQGCEIAALCDVSEMRRRWAASQLVGKPREFEEFERLLDEKDITAVINATPDHWHHDVLVAAVQAGKDVYTEKPFSHTIDEGTHMVVQVRKTKCIVQVGSHRRSGPHWAQARDAIASGAIGRLMWVRVFDTRSWVKEDPLAARPIEGAFNWKKFLGKAADRPLDEHRYWSWRWYWDYAGGLMTDLGSHQFDLINWLANVKGPKTVTANGGVYCFKKWETPDVAHAMLDYGDFAAVFSAGFVNKYDGIGARFYGTEGTLVVTDDAIHVAKEHGPEPAPKGDAWQRVYEGPAHLANWLECIRTRKEPNAPVEVGNEAVNVAHAANRAYREGRRVAWDAAKQVCVS